MMLQPTKREKELWEKFDNEKDPKKAEEILNELKKIDKEKTKHCPFAHD